MAKGTIEKRPLTEDEIADAQRLRALWLNFKAEHRVTQNWLSKKTHLGNQSLMGQYIKGHIQLNPKAVLAFADALGVHPSEISPRMNFPTTAAGEQPLSPQALVVGSAFDRLASEDQKKSIITILKGYGALPEESQQVCDERSEYVQSLIENLPREPRTIPEKPRSKTARKHASGSAL